MVESRSTPCQRTSCTWQLRTEEISLQATVAKSVSTKKLDWAFNKAVFLYIINTYFPSPKESSFHYELSFAVKQSPRISRVRNTCEGEYSSALAGNWAAVVLHKLQVDWIPEITNEKGFFSNGWWLLADFWRSSLLSPSNPFYSYHLKRREEATFTSWTWEQKAYKTVNSPFLLKLQQGISDFLLCLCHFKIKGKVSDIF